VKLLAPFIPFTCEEAWRILGKDSFVSIESWPVVLGELINPEAELSEELITKLMDDIRSIIEVLEKKPTKVFIYVASQDKLELLEETLNIIREGGQKSMGMLIPKIIKKLPAKEKQAPTIARVLLDTISSLISNYKHRTIMNVAKMEEEVYRDAATFLSRELSTNITIYREGSIEIYDPLKKADMALPFRPGIYVE
ncbi:MAG: class I tRNA ligase family protein, partial [Nitrososphaerota archaeon]